jgi:hypothetical protein
MKTALLTLLLATTVLADDPALIGKQMALAQKARTHRQLQSLYKDQKDRDTFWKAYLDAFKE